MKKKILFDSFAVLAFFKKEGKYETVHSFLQDAKDGKRQVIMNQINAGEVYYMIKKKRLVKDFDKFWETFLMLPIEFISNDFNLVIEAAAIKSQYPISFADCFVAATAIREDAVIVTGDPDFRKIKKKVSVEWI